MPSPGKVEDSYTVFTYDKCINLYLKKSFTGGTSLGTPGKSQTFLPVHGSEKEDRKGHAHQNFETIEKNLWLLI